MLAALVAGGAPAACLAAASTSASAVAGATPLPSAAPTSSASTTAPSSASPLRLALNPSEWCGKEDRLSFSLANAGATPVLVAVEPTALSKMPADVWSGNYSLMVDDDRYGLGGTRGSSGCQTTDGAGPCELETDTVTLAPGEARSWRLEHLELPHEAGRWHFGLRVEAKLRPRAGVFGETTTVTLDGRLRIDRHGHDCWRAEPLAPAASSHGRTARPESERPVGGTARPRGAPAV